MSGRTNVDVVRPLLPFGGPPHSSSCRRKEPKELGDEKRLSGWPQKTDVKGEKKTNADTGRTFSTLEKRFTMTENWSTIIPGPKHFFSHVRHL